MTLTASRWKFIALLVVSAFCISSVFSQGAHFENIKIVTRNHPEETDRILQTLSDSAWSKWDESDTNEALRLGALAFNNATEASRNDFAIDMARLLADIYYFSDNMDSSRHYSKLGIQYAIAAKDSSALADFYTSIAWTFYTNNKLDSINIYSLEAIKIGTTTNNFNTLLENNRLLGDLYYYIEDYEQAINYFDNGLRSVKESKQKLDSTALLELAGLYASYSSTLSELNRLEEARAMNNRSDSIVILLGDSLHLMWNLYGHGYLDIYDNQPLLGIEKCKEAYTYFSQSIDYAFLADGCLECIGRGFLESGELDSAEYYYNVVLEINRDSDAFDFVSDVYESLSTIYEKKGDFQKSLFYFKLFKETDDSLKIIARESNITLLQSQFRFHQLEAEQEQLMLLSKRDEAIIKGQKTANILVTLALILTALLASGLGYILKINRTRNQTLTGEVEKRTEELSQINNSLKQANAELEEFAHISSHDLKEPIRNITSFSSLIRKKGSELTNSDLNEYVSIIQFNAKQMQQLVNDIYDFTKINKEEIQLSKVYVEDVITDITKLLNGAITEKNAKIETQFSSQFIITNRGMFFVLLRNLIENGIKYNTSDQPLIKVNLDENENFFTFSISDNGIGIEQKYHDRIFGLFKRLHNRESYEGSGLGLSISKKVVNRLKGKIWLESTPDNGSTFHFTIPKVNLN